MGAEYEGGESVTLQNLQGTSFSRMQTGGGWLRQLNSDVKFKWKNQGFYKRKAIRVDFEKFTKSQILKGFLFLTKDTGLNSVDNKAVKEILKSRSDL